MPTSVSKEPVAIICQAPPQDAVSDRPDRFCALFAEAQPIVLTGERLLGAEAMRLLMRLDSDRLEARAEWNQDRFRRVTRARAKAASRLRRRWAKINPPPAIPLGKLRRPYHAISRNVCEMPLLPKEG
jgi:hypothetical protein